VEEEADDSALTYNVDFLYLNDEYQQHMMVIKFIKVLIIENCPTTLNAFNKIINLNWLANYIDENPHKILAIYFQINEALVPISTEQIELLSKRLKSNKSILISFASNVDKKSCIYWRLAKREYFSLVSLMEFTCCDEELEALSTFLCQFFINEMKNDGKSEFHIFNR
jgi:hypothetical protein